MVINSNAQNPIAKGVVVLQEPFGFDPTRFIQLADPTRERPSFVPVKWRMPHNRAENEIFLYFGSFQASTNTYFSLYSLPEALKRDFTIGDLDFPVPVVGFVIIVDASYVDRKPRLEASTILWVQHDNLPIVIAAINTKGLQEDREKLSEVIHLTSEMPVVWSAGGLTDEYVEHTLKTLYAEITK